MTINISPTVEETIQKVLSMVASNIQLSIDDKQSCNVALAGGNTPKPLYKALTQENIDWDKVQFTLTDERWVLPNHASSNEKMIEQCLISKLNKQSKFVPLKNSAVTAKAGELVCNATLTEAMNPLDLVVLGMGDDGHFASIFPNVDNLGPLLDQDNSLKCMAVSPEGKEERMSLTLSYLLTAKTICLFITGANKKKIIDDILDNKLSASQFPIAHIINQKKCPIHIYWNL